MSDDLFKDIANLDQMDFSYKPTQEDLDNERKQKKKLGIQDGQPRMNPPSNFTYDINDNYGAVIDQSKK